ncbi:ParB N-terminal domain-containing protein, partial [Porcipelethomonas sp.]|uniref:ParB N-terminal domain-containing protein n=1 Tax=Porcipelethomonas sp. TaxID=2981675 RepID=UPI0030780A71
MLATFDIGTMMSQENQIKNIPISSLVPYHDHKFQLYSGERLEDMVESVKKNGILIPIIVQPYGENYEILSGHNRTNAAKLAGLETVPAVIKERLSDDEAEMYMIETNLRQRGFDDLKISEQAAVLAMRHSKMFSEEKSRAINEELERLDGNEPSKSKLDITGEEYGMKKDSVARLLRVDKLIPELKPWVDSKQLAVRAAVELSYIPEEEQKLLYSIIKSPDNGMLIKLDIRKAKQLREAYKNVEKLSKSKMTELLIGDYKAKKSEMKPLKLPSEFYLKYFDEDTEPEKVLMVIEKALENYFNP